VAPGGSGPVGLDEVRAAHERIGPLVLRTPLVPMAGAGVVLKAESLQASGAFKLRGACNTLLQLDDDERRRGVVAHSSGNHAVAVAHAARLVGVRAVIVMPGDAPAVKIDRTRALGAEIVLVGAESGERRARARELAAAEGYRLVEPYDSEAVIAATGTIAVEIVEDLPAGGGPVEIYVAVSGGGLAAGVAMAAKALDPAIRVIGVEPELAADALASRRAGRIVELPAEQVGRTIADGLRVQRVGAVPWPYLEAHVDDMVTVSEAEIAAAMRAVAAEARLVAEPSGAAPVAAALAGRGSGGAAAHRRVAVVGGGNVDLGRFAAILAGGGPGATSRP
jgi:threonine dehydratase